MLVGAYPASDDGHGLASIVCTTTSLRGSITEMVSLFVLATNSAGRVFLGLFPRLGAAG
jgi:hypothetical protein